MEINENAKRLAILIDAENVLPAQADMIFDYAARQGVVARKEIFGAASALGAWVAPVLKYAIHPNLTIKASKGKNSSDIALVIGAMDLLVEGGIDVAIIASSDSDFSALSVRLRNAGIEVVGMGMDKSNELWRTACSTFVVLQNQKAAPKQAAQPAKPQSAPAKPPKQEAQPKQPPAQKQPGSRTARAAAMSHEERVAAIAAQIEKRLRAHDGPVQVSTLFPSLNQLAEYRVDKQGAGKKPLNYLTSTFGELFRFEEASDGQSWVSLADAAPDAAPAPDEAAPDDAAPAEPETPADAAEPATPVEEAAPAPKPARRSRRRSAAPAPEEAPEVVEPEVGPVEAAAPEDEAAAPDPLAILTAEGIEEDVARQIVEIFTDSASLREAYNKLRSVFGNTTGRDYYQQVKDIASRQ